MQPPDIQSLQQQLLATQNEDGGWPQSSHVSSGSSSWTEPTAFALLACHVFGAREEQYKRGIAWLSAQQRPDGGWAPNPSVDTSTYVTSVALMALLADKAGSDAVARAIHWTAAHVYSHDFSVGLMLARVLGLPPAHAPGSVPWFPGTAGWVIPTSLSILALSRASECHNLRELGELARSSQAYLLQRRCVDGGWNHGGSSTRSENATSYPETTGLALLSLASVPRNELTEPITLAQRFIDRPESLEGISWLQMGLMAQEIKADDPGQPLPVRTCRDASLRLLAMAMRQGLSSPLFTQSNRAKGGQEP